METGAEIPSQALDQAPKVQLKRGKRFCISQGVKIMVGKTHIDSWPELVGAHGLWTDLAREPAWGQPSPLHVCDSCVACSVWGF